VFIYLFFLKFNLACAYENGEIVAKDIEKALYWYGKAAEQGDLVAKVSRYLILEGGDGLFETNMNSQQMPK